jgi:hypothetical protein
MNKKEAEDLTNDVLIADALVQIKAIKELLVAKGIFTDEEFIKAMDDIAKKIAKSVLQKAQVKGNLDELIDSITGSSTPKKAKN